MKKTIEMIKFLSAIVAVVVIVSGCSVPTGGNGSSGNGHETLRVFFHDQITPDKTLVEAEVSKIALEKVGVGIEFVMFGPGEYSEKIPILLASNERMDVGFDSGGLGFVDRAKKGAYVDITELLETKNTRLYQTVHSSLWKGVTIDGSVYGVPTNKEIAEQWIVYVEEDILIENNINPVSIKSLADVEVVLEALKKDPERAGFMVGADGKSERLDRVRTFDTVTDDFVVKRDQGNTVLNYYMSDEYKNFVYLMRSWYEKGYIAKNVATLENYNQYMDGRHKIGVSFLSYSPLLEIFNSESYGKTLVPIKMTPTVISNDSTRGSIYGIYSKSINPEKSLDFLELWNTTPDVKNFITYGIPGKHYNLVDGKVERVSDVEKMYLNQNWATGNVFISYLTKGDPDNKHSEFQKFNDNALEAVTLGFTPDTTSVNHNLASIKAVAAEYAPLLNCGVTNPDEFLPKFINALEAAGVNEVTAELQKQFDQWKANR